MSTSVTIIFLAISFFLIARGLLRDQRPLVISGVAVLVLSILFFQFLGFWGEFLWFKSLGYEDRLLVTLATQAIFLVAGALAGGIMIYFLNYPSAPRAKIVVRFAALLGVFLGGLWGFGNWEVFLKYLYQVPTEITEPIHGLPTSFYLFSLPFYESIYNVIWLLSFLSVITSLIVNYSLNLEIYQENGRYQFNYRGANSKVQESRYQRVFLNAGIFLIILALGKVLNRYEVLFSDWGAVHGPGWVDVNIRLPAFSIVAITTLVLGILIMIPSFRNRVRDLFRKMGAYKSESNPRLILPFFGGLVLIVWGVALALIPTVWQSLRVEPNEITFEKQYIAHNIDFTRLGFRLHEVEEQEFPASDRLTSQMIQDNENIISNVRLWDWRALDAVYKQFQEIRLYYKFRDVDIDRYRIDGKYREVMVSAREMDLTNLPTQSQTFVNQRFKYTHGYGITLTTVNEFTREGLPNMIIKDIPPKTKVASLEVKQPQIYYGEETSSYVIVNSKEEELDYPKGESNAYNRYEGKGGVEMGNFWRKFIYSWKFGGSRLLFSNYPKPDSRIMFHRNIRERVKILAPFLHFDRDPYIVLADGQLYWMIDAYTTSSYFPYSEPFGSATAADSQMDSEALFAGNRARLNRANYVRNSVKATVNAYTGEVDFYIFDEKDALIQVWDKIFPGLLKPRSEMPKELASHVRYPVGMLSVQGLVYAKYHMNDPTVFYNQEDLWIRATEKYYQDVKPVSPYYIMWELPGGKEPEFVLMQPYTPKNRQVLIGWIAGLCDPDNYGRFLAYKFPKDRRVLGPQQVETKIDQNSYLSGQLTLWDQRGSNVIRGNVLAIPIENTLIYVEPIYLQAETAAYPELRLVAVMHNDRLSYAQSFEEALRGILEGVSSERPLAEEGQPANPDASQEELIQEANRAFEDYLRLQGERQFEKAGKALQELENTLNRLAKPAGDTSNQNENNTEEQDAILKEE